MNLKQKNIFMKFVTNIKIYLILVTIQKIQRFSYYQQHKNNGILKDEFKVKIIHELVRLKSKMYSLVTVDNEKI